MLMHEVMAAQSLFSAILAEAAKQNAKPVSARISCGTLNALNDDSLIFAFEAVAKGTRCEGVKLDIEHKKIQGRCKNCDECFDIDFSGPRCPKCGSAEFDLMPDAPLMLEEIEFETE